jgi:hypothetical protein
MDDEWHAGKPPFTGWWNASRSCNERTWRWWNGKHWSDYGNEGMTPEEAGECAKTKAYKTSDPDKRIKWHWRWPEGARCERIVPPNVLVLPPAEPFRLKVVK